MYTIKLTLVSLVSRAIWLDVEIIISEPSLVEAVDGEEESFVDFASHLQWPLLRS